MLLCEKPNLVIKYTHINVTKKENPAWKRKILAKRGLSSGIVYALTTFLIDFVHLMPICFILTLIVSGNINKTERTFKKLRAAANRKGVVAPNQETTVGSESFPPI